MKIEDQVFMGNGDASLAAVGYLHQQLQQALITLGGIQQPPRPCDPVDPMWDEYVKDGMDSVREIANEIHLALVGKKRGETR